MKKNFLPYILSALGVALILGCAALWRFEAAGERDLDNAMRQYGQIRTQIAHYAALRKVAGARQGKAAGSLFARVNQIGADLGLSRRIETLRPSGDVAGGRESLDLQARSLYLGEFLRFLQGVETLGDVTVDRLTLTRPANHLLDVEMRISRSGEKMAS